MPATQPLTSIEAFALALVEASSGLEAMQGTSGESPAHAGGDDGAPAVE